MQYLEADGTNIKVAIGPFVAVGDGFTPVTNVALTTADEAELLKYNAGAGDTVDINGATWAAITGCDGWYALTLTSSHTDTEGPLTVIVQDDSLCLPVFKEFMVVKKNVYDTFFQPSGTDHLNVNIKKISTSATAADNLEASATEIITGTAATGTLSINSMTTSLAAAYTQDNALNGRVVIFRGSDGGGGGTSDLKGAARTITTYAASGGTITFDSALTDAPVNNDIFVII